MLRRGHRGSTRRAAGTEVAVDGPPVRGVGVRQVVSRRRDTERCYRIDPAAFGCPTLVGQLADEWVAYARAMALTDAARYAAAVRRFATFVDDTARAAGVDAGLARLDGGPVDLVEALHDWELSLQHRHGPASRRPYELVNAILTLVAQRGTRGAAVGEQLRARAAGRPLSGRGAVAPLDEFSNVERLRLRRWARADITALEERLARGRAMLAQGVDPRLGGWSRPENLVWAARHGLLTTQTLAAQLPAKVTAWPPAQRALLPADGGAYHGLYGLLMAVAGLLFPSEMDLQPFRVLLLLATSRITPEELHDLRLDDIEFTDGGVRLLQHKARAARYRVRVHRDVPEPADDGGGRGHEAGAGAGQQIEAHRGQGRWDVPGLLRRLLAVTATAREVFDAGPWLFLAVQSRNRRTTLDAAVAQFKRPSRRFTHWIAAHQPAPTPPGGQDAATAPDQPPPDAPGEPGAPPESVISMPHDVRRLRKTAKTARVAALGGTLSDLAGDDHHVEVFRGHYAHGTTAHVLAAHAINQAQDKVFRRVTSPATANPVFLDADIQQRLAEPDVAAEIGLTAGQATAISTGAADMGLTHCRNPYDSPHTPPAASTGGVCHVAPAMCLLCPNAVITTAQLPRLLHLSDHIDVQRRLLDPRQWQALWGRQAAALSHLFAEIPELVEAARRAPSARDNDLDLPLGMRTEYHR